MRRRRRPCDSGYTILILSDRGVSEEFAPIPSLLATAGVHHHLVRQGARTRCALVVESGDAREVHHVALLMGYGAGAVNPYLAFESLEDMLRQRLLEGITHDKAVINYIRALNKGILKVMSKMGISTLQSYCGAQIFEAIGLESKFVDRYFTHTASRIGGVGPRGRRERSPAAAHARVPDDGVRRLRISSRAENISGGATASSTCSTPTRCSSCSTRRAAGNTACTRSTRRSSTTRAASSERCAGLLDFRRTQPAVALDEVEPVESIVKRFATGAMSYGSISLEAHETLAIAMNRMGGRSNCGEGGEDPARYHHDANGDSRRSAVKQVASARFGVTSEYLVNSTDLQIKMAQGAKPGEGGQLPGPKVYPWIAKVRNSTPGVTLISPPPHHDIYSIEDLAQLIHDLKNANPLARIHVKLVAEVGVGTISAGVAKAHADVVLISGHDGGTGASPLTAIKHSGIPWELGLAETQQVLMLNNLRDRITVQVDGQLKTGRDVVIAALLGAEEFGFATAALVVSGCVMMRVCHLNTCPVGIATQDPELRKKFTGKPEFVENYFRFVAEEVRELMAELGFRNVDEMVGRVDRLEMRHALAHWKAAGVDLSEVLHAPDVLGVRNPPEGPCAGSRAGAVARQSDHRAGGRRARAKAADRTALPGSERQPDGRARGSASRSRGVTARRGCPTTRFACSSPASAGQSFGAFVPAGVTLTLEGDANDFVGKGLSGARLIVYPPRLAAIHGRREHHRRQRRALRRDERRGVHPGDRGRALCRPQQRRPRCRRGSGRSRLRVHDGRSRPRPRAHGPQLRRGYERRRRVRHERRRHVRAPLQHGPRRHRAARGTGRHRARAADAERTTCATRRARLARTSSPTGHRRGSSK